MKRSPRHVFPLKRIVSFVLCLLLVNSVVSGLPRASADELPPMPDGMDEYLWSQCMELYQAHHCLPIPGGEVLASQLEEGGAYTFTESTTLVLDVDRSLKAVCCAGGLAIKGEACLTAEMIYAFYGGAISVESGTVVCPVMDNPPEPGTIIQNGLCGTGGVVINGGSVECPVISSGPETVSVCGGTVKVSSISALFGYGQSGGTVEAGSIWAREGFSISGGQLTAGYIYGMFVSFHGGVSLVECAETEYGRVQIAFPMAVTEPAGARWQEGQFVDADGNPVDRVRIERLQVENPFTDVSPKKFYYTSVLWAAYTGVTKGVEETLFAPGRGCTRAEAVTFLWRAEGCPQPEGAAPGFTDVPAKAYYADAVRWAVEQGITKGTTKTTFSPEEPCTRAQIVTFLWRDAGSIGDPDYVTDYFEDVPSSAYYARAVTWGAFWLANGTGDGKFSPDRICSRGEIVTFLYRYFN